MYRSIRIEKEKKIFEIKSVHIVSLPSAKSKNIYISHVPSSTSTIVHQKKKSRHFHFDRDFPSFSRPLTFAKPRKVVSPERNERKHLDGKWKKKKEGKEKKKRRESKYSSNVVEGRIICGTTAVSRIVPFFWWNGGASQWQSGNPMERDEPPFLSSRSTPLSLPPPFHRISLPLLRDERLGLSSTRLNRAVPSSWTVVPLLPLSHPPRSWNKASALDGTRPYSRPHRTPCGFQREPRTRSRRIVSP